MSAKPPPGKSGKVRRGPTEDLNCRVRVGKRAELAEAAKRRGCGVAVLVDELTDSYLHREAWGRPDFKTYDDVYRRGLSVGEMQGHDFIADVVVSECGISREELGIAIRRYLNRTAGKA